ncbi:MAG TPA: multidrug effflux MFS transporter [Rhodanobacteraceae bacterium]|nr:multidrug effflux MFS transporter [Rhodanobacteraceae bacterium]
MAAQSARRAAVPALSLLAFMMAVGPFGDTEYTPAMPAMAKALHADYGMVQFTMSSYLVGSSISQLIYGPASDRFGRRPVMLVGAVILILGAALCMVSFSIWPLIAGRLVQGVGACAGGVIADAAVRDAFAADIRQRVYAKLNAAFALAPAIGPVVGTYVAHAFGWHANFAILLGLSLLLGGLVWYYLPETNRNLDARALELSRLWRNGKGVVTTRGFLFYVVLGGLCVGVVYTALIGAPDLVINVLRMGSGAIAIVAGAILVAFVIGAGSCAWFTRRVPPLWIIAAGLAVILGGAGALMGVAVIAGGKGSFASYLLPIAICFVGVGLVVPVSTAKAMAPFGDTAGAASSLMGFIRMGVAALGTIAMSAMHKGSVYDIPIVFLALVGVAILVYAVYLVVRGPPPEAKKSEAK